MNNKKKLQNTQLRATSDFRHNFLNHVQLFFILLLTFCKRRDKSLKITALEWKIAISSHRNFLFACHTHLKFSPFRFHRKNNTIFSSLAIFCLLFDSRILSHWEINLFLIFFYNSLLPFLSFSRVCVIWLVYLLSLNCMVPIFLICDTHLCLNLF